MSTILVNTLTGTSTAGSIAVTGEGNSTTTNLQQGLAKAWIDYKGTSTNSIRDSLNFASVSDNGTGDYTFTFANSMANTNYAVVSTAANGTSHGDFQGVDAIVNATGNVRNRTCFVTGTDSSSSSHNVLNLHIAVFGD